MLQRLGSPFIKLSCLLRYHAAASGQTLGPKLVAVEGLGSQAQMEERPVEARKVLGSTPRGATLHTLGV